MRDPGPGEHRLRLASVGDADDVARLLRDFNLEFDEPTPAVGTLAERARDLLERDEITVLLAGEPPFGLAQVRFRTSLWTGAPDAYLEELYVAPDRRGRGAGRALLEATMERAREAGAAHLDLVTSEADEAARALYESCGFDCREGDSEGPLMIYYERDL